MSLPNKNLSTRELIPDLLGGKAATEPKRPGAEPSRHAFVEDGTLTTYVVPGDWPENSGRWYSPEVVTFNQTRSNALESYIDAGDAYEAMAEAIETATGDDHFIILVGWTAHLDFFVVPYGATRTTLFNKTMGTILQERAALGVKIRALFYGNLAPEEFSVNRRPYVNESKIFLDGLNARGTNLLETPRRAITILDGSARTREVTAHHQKLLIVQGSEGLIGFFGGIDVNPDRLQGKGDGRPLHDVHARVAGPSAEHLLKLVTERWNYSQPWHAYAPESDATWSASAHDPDDFKGPDPALPSNLPESSLPDNGRDIEDMSQWLAKAQANQKSGTAPFHLVQVAQTVGNPRLAQKGTTSECWPLIKGAIAQANKFIYIEDQYFWSEDLARALAAQLPRLAHVTIILPRNSAGPTLRAWAMSMLAKNASASDLQKIEFYVRKGVDHSYIHAKMFVFDDELAIIGSANANNRGYFSDSEVVGGVADLAWDDSFGARRGKWYKMELNWAHRLRIQLWEHHLKMPAESLYDGVAAGVHWRSPRSDSNIETWPDPWRTMQASQPSAAERAVLDPMP